MRGARTFEVWHASYLFFGLAIAGLLSVQLPMVIVDAGHRPFRVGAVVACENGGIALAPLWGWLADRFRAARPLLVASLLLIGASFAALGTQRGLDALLLSGLVMGIGAGGCSTATVLLVTARSPRDRAGGGLAAVQMLGALGAVLGFVGAGLLAPRLGMRIAALLCAPALLAALRAPSPGSGPPVDPLHRPAPEGRPAAGGLGGFLLAWLLFSVSVSQFSSLYPITMAREFGIAVARSSGALALATAASLPLYVAIGRVLRRRSAVAPFIVGVAGRAAALTLLAVLPRGGAGVALLGAAVFQALWPAIGVPSSALSARLAPRHAGLAIGLVQATGSVASSAGALLSGFVADRWGYADVLPAAAVMAIAALGATATLHRPA